MSGTGLVLITFCVIIAAALTFTQFAGAGIYDQGQCPQSCQLTYDRSTYPGDYSRCVSVCRQPKLIDKLGQGPPEPGTLKPSRIHGRP